MLHVNSSRIGRGHWWNSVTPQCNSPLRTWLTFGEVSKNIHNYLKILLPLSNYFPNDNNKMQCDNESLLDQTLVTLLKLLSVPSVHFLIKSTFSKNSQFSKFPILCIWSLMVPIQLSHLPHPAGNFWSSGLSSAIILLTLISQNPPYPDASS